MYVPESGVIIVFTQFVTHIPVSAVLLLSFSCIAAEFSELFLSDRQHQETVIDIYRTQYAARFQNLQYVFQGFFRMFEMLKEKSGICKIELINPIIQVVYVSFCKGNILYAALLFVLFCLNQ